MKPLVSIIIPTYNRANLIGKTLDSIISQTFTHWECLVIDDGSTDGTDVVMDQYCEKDKRFQYHHRPKNTNKGANTCRNYGLELSKGSYVNWFDSDDLMLEEALQKKVDCLSNFNFCISGFQLFENEYSIISNKYNTDIDDTILNSFIDGKLILNTPSVMLKKNLIGQTKFDENLTRAQDLDFFFKILIKPDCKTGYLNEITSLIRLHEDTITNNFNSINKVDLASELKVRQFILREIKSKKMPNICRHFKLFYQTLSKAILKSYPSLFFKYLFQYNFISLKNKVVISFYYFIYTFSKKGLSSYSKYINKLC